MLEEKSKQTAEINPFFSKHTHYCSNETKQNGEKVFSFCIEQSCCKQIHSKQDFYYLAMLNITLSYYLSKSIGLKWTLYMTNNFLYTNAF